MKKILFLLFFLFSISLARTQLLNWSPSFPVENDALTTVAITVDVTKGNQGLLNYAPTTDVYVHIGVITNLSTSSTDWRYVRFVWGTTNDTARCVSNGIDKWSYTIFGRLDSFFKIKNAGEHIQKIAILFRNGNGSKVQRNADNSDMYIPVYDNAIAAVRFTDPPLQPLFLPQPEPLSKTVGDNINLTAIANKTSTMRLYLNGTMIQTASNATTITANPTLAAGGNTVVV